MLLVLTHAQSVSLPQCYWARGQSDNYSALNLALGALFFRSCMPDLGTISDTHQHLNLPPLPANVKELEEELTEAGGKDVEKGSE